MDSESEHNSTEDPYSILGISPGASLEEIKEAYRKLAKKFHPDVEGDPDQFRKVKEAKERAIAAHETSTDLVVLSKTDLERFADEAHIRLLLTTEIMRQSYLEKETFRARENTRFLIRGGILIPILLFTLSIVQQMLRMNPTTLIGLASAVVAIVLVVLQTIKERALARSEKSRDTLRHRDMGDKFHILEGLALDPTVFEAFRKKVGEKGAFSFESAAAVLSMVALKDTRLQFSHAEMTFVILRWEDMGRLKRSMRHGVVYLDFQSDI
ncbi:MAG: J domain-containing protein [Thermoplasmata archaeon]|nr:J domain-containing protein [Thermoplasmata archaeon]